MSDQLSAFRAALQCKNDQTILDRFYYAAQSHVINVDQEAELRRSISDHLGVSMRDVIVTGSAKLGFTIVQKPGRPVFSPFSDQSDIDVTIISERLFHQLWVEVNRHHAEAGSWTELNSFRKYLMKGWIRPDLLPKVDFAPSRDWFELFRGLTASGKYGIYKISGGLYHSDVFWEDYARTSFSKCRLAIESPL